MFYSCPMINFAMYCVGCVLTRFKHKEFSSALFPHFSGINKNPEQWLLTKTDLCNPSVTKCVHSARTSMVLRSFINLPIINTNKEAGKNWEKMPHV